MADTSFLTWPFFEPRHREYADRLDAWAAAHLGHVDHADVDATCRSLVARLGRDSFRRRRLAHLQRLHEPRG